MVETLDGLCDRGYSSWDVFNDWLDLVLYALQRDDDAYLDIVEKYDNDAPRGEREIDLYTQAFGQLQEGMAATDADLLGGVYEELAMTSDAFGQYFTPHNVCDTMAEIQMVGSDEDGDEPYGVHDPACGSGRLLITAAKKQPDAVFYGQDKDVTCTKMTALNLGFFNLDGYAVHGDSLRNEQRRVWQTRYTPLGGEIRELDRDEFASLYADAAQERNEHRDEVGDEYEDDGETLTLRETTLTDFQDEDSGA